MYNLPERMDAGIRPAAGGDPERPFRQDFEEGALQGVLHGLARRLGLPAGKRAAIIGQG